MIITSELVWNGFRALHRYLLPIGSAGKLAVPYALPDRPSPTAQHAAETLAAMADTCWHAQPILVSPQYYAYLFVFCQSLRVSFPHTPTHTQRGWSGLCWYPLGILKSRADLPALKAWNRFYHQYVAVVRPRPEQSALSVYFPWIEDYIVLSARTLQQHMTAFHALEDQGESREDILSKFGNDGQPLPAVRHPFQYQWHPLLVWSLPEAWVDAGPATQLYYRQAMTSFLQVPKIWGLWADMRPFIYRDPACTTWPLVRAQMERYYKNTGHRHDVRTWKRQMRMEANNRGSTWTGIHGST